MFDREYVTALEDIIMDELLPMYIVGCRSVGRDPKSNLILEKLMTARMTRRNTLDTKEKRIIYKYNVGTRVPVQACDVVVQANRNYVWVWHKGGEEGMSLETVVVGTGWDLSEYGEEWFHIQTVEEQQYVWHILGRYV